ncbi:hypothetical protein [Bacillus alkalicellulosilyticus]|uniref:hypothetical protein n=1 Tax=Alkalihalobacterium alkalicellulosilyticum TaxID=1912214 RepID=UPI0009961A56|nr:hypothetical protein [Bacillus alkalicellulosilyticus]
MQNQHDMKSLCQSYMNQSVVIQMTDQKVYQGIIEHVDDENVYLVVQTDGGDMMHHGGEYRNDERFYGPGFAPGYGAFPGYGYPGWGYPRPGYWYGPRPGFGRLALPLAGLAAISLLPFFYI